MGGGKKGPSCRVGGSGARPLLPSSPAPQHSRGWQLHPRLTSTWTHSTAEEFTQRASNVLSVPKWHSRAVSWGGGKQRAEEPQSVFFCSSPSKPMVATSAVPYLASATNAWAVFEGQRDQNPTLQTGLGLVPDESCCVTQQQAHWLQAEHGAWSRSAPGSHPVCCCEASWPGVGRLLPQTGPHGKCSTRDEPGQATFP